MNVAYGSSGTAIVSAEVPQKADELAAAPELQGCADFVARLLQQNLRIPNVSKKS